MDIVQRLRVTWPHNDTAAAAADEIARLRAENEALVEDTALRTPTAVERDMQEVMRINNELKAENERLRAAITPFLQYYEDISFNLRKQPHPTDSAIIEHGERIACVTWAQFRALRAALADEGATHDEA